MGADFVANINRQKLEVGVGEVGTEGGGGGGGIKRRAKR